MPPIPSSDHKKTIIILLVVAAIAVLGFWYYKYGSFRFVQGPAVQPSPSGHPVFTPLPEPTDLRFIQGKIDQIVGKALIVKVNKLVAGKDFASNKIVTEEYKVIVGAKTELVKLTSDAGVQKSAKAVLKDFKKGNAVAAYASQNLINFKEFTAVKVEILSR